MRVSVLGPIAVESTEERLGPRDRVVLAALVLHGGETVSGERLADALWGDDVPSSWTKVVQGCVVRLRKALGAEAIETHAQGYRLVVAAEDVDARRFERTLRQARDLLELGDPERAAFAAEEALSLWRGRPLVDLEEWEPGRIEARRLEELRLEAEDLRLDAALRAGRHREVQAAARALVDAWPTRERRWELLALAQYRSGGQGDALRTLHEARTVLAEQLGLGPGPDLVALEHAILRQDPSLAAPPTPAEASSACPWPGLPAYGVEDAESFFGREHEIDVCLERLASDGLLVVVGPSGSGKSSLVRAGVAARLGRNGRRVVVVSPAGGVPTDVLPPVEDGGEATVLVVDQYDEVVTSGADLGEQRRFFAELVARARRGPLVVALRADRVGDVTVHAEFARLVERGLFLLGPLDEGSLRRAIEGPARQAALRLEPGLVDLVVRDVLYEPGALPLMSHALRQTWTRRQGRTLTVAAYRETGGIRGAVAQSAESLYAGVDEQDRTKLRELLLRLVTPIGDGQPTRARIPRHLVSDEPGYEPLFERLVAARLVTSDDEYVELAHEALARAWPRLKDWLDEDVDGVRILRHLTTAAVGWQALGRPESELYRGVRLAQAVEWRARAEPALTAVEREFLETSADREMADVRRAEVEVVRERRTVRRLRRLVAGVAVLGVSALVASAVAVDERDRAGAEARTAQARRLAAEALVARPLDRALLLAVEAVRLHDTPEIQGNLLSTIDRSPRLRAVMRFPGERVLDLELSPTDRRAAIVDRFGDLTTVDLATREQLGKLDADGDIYYGAPAFSPDGRQLAVAQSTVECASGGDCSGSHVTVVSDDLATERASYQGLGAAAVDVAYSSDGRLLAAAPPFATTGPVGRIAVWRVGEPSAPAQRLALTEAGADLRLSPDHFNARGWLSFSPAGDRLYASGAGPTDAFDVTSGQVLWTAPGIGGLALSRDGSTLAVATSPSGVTLHDTATGAARTQLAGHEGVTAAAFSADGDQLATSGNDESVVVWDATTGARLLMLRGHTGSVLDVAFASDGATLFSSSADGSVFQWDLAGSSGLARTLAAPTPGPQTEGFVLVNPTGTSILVANERGRFVDLVSGRVRELPSPATEGVVWAAYRPDGKRLVTVNRDGSTKLWTDNAQLVASQPGRGQDNSGAVAFSAGGHLVVVADADGEVVVLDGETLEPTGKSVSVDVAPEGVRTGPGGLFAVTASRPDPAGGTEIVFGDVDTGRTLRRVHVNSWRPRANFSPDGSKYAVGGFDGRVEVVDVATGRRTGRGHAVHAGPVAWVTFSPDGRTLASLGFDGELQLSDARNATPRTRVVPGPVNRRGSLGWRADGHTLVLGYEDGMALAYDTDPKSWVAQACRVAGRDLTAEEWQDAFGNDEPHRSTCGAAPSARPRPRVLRPS